MTEGPTTRADRASRFRLHRAGILNVWQYDDQEFYFGDGRLLLRGTNGAGKSKTLELLLPFCLDGNSRRMSTTQRSQTPLTWLMADGGDDGQLRIGYVWVEFRRTTADGRPEHLTCGVGLRASASSGVVTTWMFCTPQRVGRDLALDNADGPLSRAAMLDAVETPGRVFDTARDFRAHIGQRLFGLDAHAYDDLLKLLYWLRQPSIGEEIDPITLSRELDQSLPELDRDALDRAGATFDELADFGDRLRRTEASAGAVSSAAAVYARYATATLQQRSDRLVEAQREQRRLQRSLRGTDKDVEELEGRLVAHRVALAAADERRRGAAAELHALRLTPDEARLDAQRRRSEDAAAAADRGQQTAVEMERARGAATRAREQAAEVATARARSWDAAAAEVVSSCSEHGVDLPSGFAAPAGAERALTASPPDPHVANETAHASVRRWTEAQAAALSRLDEAAAARRAAAEDVRGKALEHVRLSGLSERAGKDAEDAAARADRERAAVEKARGAAEQAARTWAAAFAAWRSLPPAFELPVLVQAGDRAATDLVGATWLAGLRLEVASAAEPHLAEREQLDRVAAVAVAQARSRVEATADELRRVESEKDPHPPATPLPRRRDRQAGALGAPLWQAVDFATDVPARERAALEAALQQSGLLDAWVDPTGALLDASTEEVVLTPAARVEGPSLLDVLQPEPGHEVVGAVLASVAWLPDGCAVGTDPSGGASTAVGGDGSFRLGALRGRASKATAQFIGATARAAERARRLAELSVRLAERRAELAEFVAQQEEAAEVLAGLRAWLAALPEVGDLIRAGDRLEQAERVLAAAEREAEAADAAAAAARALTASALRALTEAAEPAALPVDPAALSALLQAVGQLARRVQELLAGLDGLVRAAAALDDSLADERAATDAWARARTTAAELDAEAAAQAQAYRSLGDALSDTLADLDRRRAGAQRSQQESEETIKALEEQLRTTGEEIAVRRERSRHIQRELSQQDGLVVTAGEQLARLHGVPGLFDSAGIELSAEERQAVAASLGDEPVVDRALSDAAGRWRQLEVMAFDPNDLSAAWRDLVASAAGHHQPRLVTVLDVQALLGQDGQQEIPIGELARLLADRSREQAQLLEDRERAAFETVLLGSLGHELRSRLQEAHELVEAMNQTLAGVRTSQGIQVRLRWRPREDTPAEAVEISALVGRTSSTLLPDERDRLHAAMRSLVDRAAAEAPEAGYAEHLSRALDYRGWQEFRVQFRRGSADAWHDLSRRSALSQGEQKVACYLPLFAAAAAHFHSLSGVAPHAPRFVLLDDAFPKIDARTHPLLFGLLVDLELDFVITSERLWGDHPTVPRLEIYEALRSPGEPGIAQAHYTWDGRLLQSVAS